MHQLNQELLNKASFWENKNVQLPKYDRSKSPIRGIAFAAGRMAFGHTGDILQDLLDEDANAGQIVGVKSNSYKSAEELIQSDSLMTQLIFENEKGVVNPRIIGALKETLYCNGDKSSESWIKLMELARDPELQFATINAPEMIYGMTYNEAIDEGTPVDDNLIKDMQEGTIETDPAKWTAFALERFNANKLKFTFVSCTNFSANGKVTKATLITIAKAWEEKGFAAKGFVEYLSDENLVGFPSCMIDRIAVAPDQETLKKLEELGISSPLVVTEKARYWVVEDTFPNGRPAFEKAQGVIFEKNYDEVKKYEDMKLRVLNMAHSVIAHTGVLLGYRGNYGVYKGIQDAEIKKLIDKIINIVGKVIPSPNQMNVSEFASDTINRLLNANIPDDPMRIAFGGSSKMHPRFLETYFEAKEKGLPAEECNILLLPVAGFLRYTLGVDDQNEKYNLGDDSFLDQLKAAGSSTSLGATPSVEGFKELISNASIMGKDLYLDGDSGKTLETLLSEMLHGTGAVRSTLQKYL